MGSEVLRGHQELLVLEALGRGRAHGYAVIQDIRARSGGAFELAEGTVYPVLRKLEDEGLVTSRWSTSTSGRRRREYELSKKGRAALAHQRDAWFSFARGMNAVLRGAT